MNWVDFKGVTFNLDNVTHFYIGGDPRVNPQLRAYLNIGYPEIRGDGKPQTKEHQAYIVVATGTMEECRKWMTEIASGEHSLPCKYLYFIQKNLRQIDEKLGEIAGSIERFSQKE
ncbi:MAG: hypothetical protein OXI24_12285 [Candidatus Poribacteria bacterium]|nr:hypothetical protein [Candidatus Poribacteria bacterium]